MAKIAVLVSGNGSNLQAIMDAIHQNILHDIEIAVVISNRKDAYGMQRAIQSGIPVVYFPLMPYTRSKKHRSEYDRDLANIVQQFNVEWVVMAGWMHIFTSAFLKRYPNQILNLHPALPGTFPGAHAIEDAFKAFRRGEISHTGVMVHLVPDEKVDAGPVLATVEVPIHKTDTLESLEARIHAAEHPLLVQTIHSVIRTTH
jgi:formyltetrahydrofolate-dependent phosphoribosylglycinamide formyltransferase